MLIVLLASWLVGWLVGWRVGWLVSWLVGQTAAQLVAQALVDWMAVVWTVDSSLVRWKAALIVAHLAAKKVNCFVWFGELHM